MSRRVVVTGLGIVCAVGNNVPDTWTNIINGKGGMGPITKFDASNHLVKIAAETKGFDPKDHMPAKLIRRSDPYQHLIWKAAMEAHENAGIEYDDNTRQRTSAIIGSAVGGMSTFQTWSRVADGDGDPRRISPFAVPMFMANGGSDMVALELGLQGPSATLVSACATGADCIGLAYDLIKSGRIDKAMAGAGENPILPLGVAAFDRIGACSRDNDNPETAMKPFDANRTGMVFGEGAGVIVIEELESAKARGANILAELVAYASTSDAFHLTAPDPDANGAIEALRLALNEANMTPQDIDYINAHGTATQLNDEMETKAIKTVFGDHAYNVPMSSTKSMTGHAMGATAAMEAVFSTLAIRDNIAPPTINLENPSETCDLDYVPNTAREMPIDVVMSNAFGFGGHNVSLIFKRFND